MKSSDLLVFTTCYNERDNIGLLLDRIVQELPDADILVVEDNSPDGTWDIILEKSKTYRQIAPVQRPRKLGIGSAHKYALLFAIREGYDTLITMDADFSHDPKYLPALLRAYGENTFVTGSRYCEGGSSDYKGYRNIVSRLGNIAARLALGVAYFRIFDVKSLRRLPLRRVTADGYSYGVQLIYYLRKRGVDLREVPIHFVDRSRGASKIPRMQILREPAWISFDRNRIPITRASPMLCAVWRGCCRSRWNGR
jgi:dolichol-phosphate mannosyltransferase